MSLPNPNIDFTAFNVLTADQLDDLAENDQALAAGTGLNNGVITNDKLAVGAGQPGGAWNTYTPTWNNGGTLGNGTRTARYKVVGKTVTVNVNYIFGSTSTYGGSGWSWSLPVAPSTTQKYCIGTGWALDPGSAIFAGAALLTTASASVTINHHSTGSSWGSGVPFQFGPGDELAFTIVYEAL